MSGTLPDAVGAVRCSLRAHVGPALSDVPSDWRSTRRFRPSARPAVKPLKPAIKPASDGGEVPRTVCDRFRPRPSVRLSKMDMRFVRAAAGRSSARRSRRRGRATFTRPPVHFTYFDGGPVRPTRRRRSLCLTWPDPSSDEALTRPPSDVARVPNWVELVGFQVENHFDFKKIFSLPGETPGPPRRLQQG